MKQSVVMLVAICVVAIPFAEAQAPPAPPAAQKTLAATMNVYVFPTEGQAADQQSKDEAECYNFAVTNTGNDPFDLAKKAQEQDAQAQQSKEAAKDVGKGAGASGAVKGAAAGALIGEIANDDAGQGAAYGAAAGLIRGRRKGRQAQQQAQAAAEQQGQQAQAATAEQLANFKKAFSVCLEAKNYMVRF